MNAHEFSLVEVSTMLERAPLVRHAALFHLHAIVCALLRQPQRFTGAHFRGRARRHFR
jgi:hypothetical protein